MRFCRLAQPKSFVANVGNCAVDEFEDRPRRAEALPQIQVAQAARLAGGAQLGKIGGESFHLTAHPVLRPREVFRAGPLKAEDRLLVIANHEQGAQLVAMRAFPGKEIAGQGIDDFPLGFVGILRFVDQDVIKAPVQLVADPFGQIAARQQGSRLTDLVVKVDIASPRLGIIPQGRKLAAQFQRRGQEIGQFQQGTAVAHGLAAVQHRLGRLFIELFELGDVAQVLGPVVEREQLLHQFRQGFQPLSRAAFQPGLDRRRAFLSGGR